MSLWSSMPSPGTCDAANVLGLYARCPGLAIANDFEGNAKCRVFPGAVRYSSSEPRVRRLRVTRSAETDQSPRKSASPDFDRGVPFGCRGTLHLRLRDRAGPGRAQGRRQVTPRAARLDVRGVGTGHRAVQAELVTVLVDPLPDNTHISVFAGDIDRLSMAIAAGPDRAAVQRIARLRLETRGEALTIVVAEGAR